MAKYPARCRPPLLAPRQFGGGNQPYAVALRSSSSSLAEIKLFEGAPQNRLGVQAHPLLQQRRVGAAEVIVPLEIAFVQLLRLQGRILPIQATLDRIADHKGPAARAVVCARTVLLHAAAELSEHEDHHLLIGMVLLQIMVEGTDSAGYIIPQFGEGDVLVGVGIEGAWVHTGVRSEERRVGKEG